MNYREIVKLNIRAAIKKKEASRTEQDKSYWDKIVAMLIYDLRDYEERERWTRIPGIVFNLDDLMKRFFEEW